MLAYPLHGTAPAGHVLEHCKEDMPQAIYFFMQLHPLLFPPFQISPALLFLMASSVRFLKGVEKSGQETSWLQTRSTKGWGFCPGTSGMSTNALITPIAAHSLLAHHGEVEAAQPPGQAHLHSPYFHMTFPMGIFWGKFSKEINTSPTIKYFSAPFSPVLSLFHHFSYPHFFQTGAVFSLHTCSLHSFSAPLSASSCCCISCSFAFNSSTSSSICSTCFIFCLSAKLRETEAL